MAKRKKPKVTTKPRKTIFDRIPTSLKETLELELFYTERVLRKDDGTMARQAARIREEIKNLK